MGGLAGILSLDERPISVAALRAMLGGMRHRGVDGFGEWHRDSVGLGHLAFHTTPEAILTAQPFRNDEIGLVLAADARIDNRVDLHHKLDLPRRLSAYSDAAIILEAYRAWGEDCPTKLLGDFAFAIWDLRERKLFCARDHAGVRPFYYHHMPNRLFAFASDINGLLGHGEVSAEINEVRVADYLADIFVCHEHTFYKDIMRLPPAHVLVADAAGIRIRRYWELIPERELRLRNDEEYAEVFRETFDDAVRCRLRAPEPPATFLSGGLDSSTVTCAAEAHLRVPGSASPLKTFSLVYPELPECDERLYIDAVLENGGWFAPTFVDGQCDNRPIAALHVLVGAYGQPLSAPGMSSSLPLLARMAENGVRVVLEGHGGDEVVSHGRNYRKELALRGRWLQLLREIHPLSKKGVPETVRVWTGHVTFGIEGWLRSYPHTGRIRTAMQLIRSRLHSQYIRSTPTDLPFKMISPALVDAVNLSARHEQWNQGLPAREVTERLHHFRSLMQPLQSEAFEMHAALYAAYGIEARYPFWDKRVVELCLSMPAHMKLRNGYGRYVMRLAYRDMLPESVARRIDKTDFTSNLRHGLFANEEGKVTDNLVGHKRLCPFINSEEVANMARYVADSPDEALLEHLAPLLKVHSLTDWLAQQDDYRRETECLQQDFAACTSL